MTIDLTDVEVEAYEDLIGRLAAAKRELSIAYTMSLAARGHKGKQVLSTDLKNKRLTYKDGGNQA